MDTADEQGGQVAEMSADPLEQDEAAIARVIGDLEEIPAPCLAEECALQLDEGLEKRLRILHKPFGGNALFFYDENLRLIQDAHSLYHSQQVILINQARAVGEPLRGRVLLDQQVPLYGRPSPRKRLILECAGGTHTFRDEYSLWHWSVQNPSLLHAKAYLQQ